MPTEDTAKLQREIDRLRRENRELWDIIRAALDAELPEPATQWVN
jgi:hypothetical protein